MKPAPFTAIVLCLGLFSACGGDGSEGTGSIGAACGADTDCEPGMFCSKSDPGGQCLKTCDSQADCPPDSTCTDAKSCYRTCATALDCSRAGYSCGANLTCGG